MCGCMFWVWLLLFFFFSSRRRHTRLVSDWSSDVCSSDLRGDPRPRVRRRGLGDHDAPQLRGDRKSVVEGKSVDLGGRRIIKKKKKEEKQEGRERREQDEGTRRVRRGEARE